MTFGSNDESSIALRYLVSLMFPPLMGILLSCVFTATSEKIAKILRFALYPFCEVSPILPNNVDSIF